MDALDDIILRGLLATDEHGVMLTREDDRMEYKESFDNTSKVAKAKYAKEMAALYNYEGGYIVFGVEDSTLRLVGLDNFGTPDNANLVNDINNYFSPSIRFKTKVFSIHGKTTFIIYVDKRKSIPTVCVKGYQEILKESTIYWRYSAKSAPISAGDLIHLLNDLKGENSKELAEVAKRDFRSKFKPRLRTRTSTSREEFGIFIDNDGEDAIVDSFSVTESNIEVDKIFLYRWNQPVAIKKGSYIKITGNSTISANQLTFKMELKYHDTEQHNYRTTISWERGKSRMEDPVYVE